MRSVFFQFLEQSVAVLDSHCRIRNSFHKTGTTKNIKFCVEIRRIYLFFLSECSFVEKCFFYFSHFPFDLRNCPFGIKFETTRIICSEKKLFFKKGGGSSKRNRFFPFYWNDLE